MNRLIILLTALIFISTASLTNAQYLQDLSLQKNITGITDSTLQTQSKNIKSPVLAGVLSFAFPGLAFGQLYNNQPEKFFIHICLTGASLFGAMCSVTSLPLEPGGGSHRNSQGQWVFYISAVVFIGNWTWSVVDAVISANKINKNIELRRNRSGVQDKLKFGLTVDKNKQFNFKFALEL